MLVAALCLLIGGIWMGTKITTDYLLYKDATSTARNWADLLAQTVTDLEQIAAGERPTRASMTLFEWAQKAGQVFRKIFKVRYIGGNANAFQIGDEVFNVVGTKAVNISS